MSYRNNLTWLGALVLGVSLIGFCRWNLFTASLPSSATASENRVLGVLSGRWSTDDGRDIVLKQLGDQIFWTCVKRPFIQGTERLLIGQEAPDHTRDHTFRGRLEGNRIVGSFVNSEAGNLVFSDPPDGSEPDEVAQALDRSGTLEIQVADPRHLKLIKSTGLFSADSIEKVSDSLNQGNIVSNGSSAAD